MISPACLRLRRPVALLALALLAAVAAGCGSGNGATGNAKPPPGVSKRNFAALLADAEHVSRADFEPAGGRTLAKIASIATVQAQVGFATSVIEPGPNRVAFGVIDQQNNFLYGRSAVY